jgi:hypothetical protein
VLEISPREDLNGAQAGGGSDVAELGAGIERGRLRRFQAAPEQRVLAQV